MGLNDVLNEAEFQVLLAQAPRRRSSRREVLFHAGDPADSLHLIEQGRVAIRITTERGDVTTLDVAGPGELVGELALLAPDGRRSATAVALEATQTRIISSVRFRELRASHQAIDELMFEILAKRIQFLNERLIEALYTPVETRVARRLLQVARHYGDGALVAEVTVPLTQEDLAGLAGTTRESVNRLVRRWQDQEILRLGRGSIAIVDPIRLERLGR